MLCLTVPASASALPSAHATVSAHGLGTMQDEHSWAIHPSPWLGAQHHQSLQGAVLAPAIVHGGRLLSMLYCVQGPWHVTDTW